jgi:hypothetical protein
MIMKKIRIKAVIIVSIFFSLTANSQDSRNPDVISTTDKVQALKDTLAEMIKQTDNELFINSCKWFTQVIDAQEKLTPHDSSVLSATYDTFCVNAAVGNCRKYSSYLNRQRPLIIAWQSPTDGKISFSTLMLPKDWNPENTYPLYIQLHGMSSAANLPIDYLTRYYLKAANTSYAYEDGYLLSPWGRGNLWYQGISETDIWECKAAFEQMVKIDPKRQYLKGHSMGGYGAWYIASKSAGVWAALGIQAGAFQYDNGNLLRDEPVQALIDLPTYFVTGTQDGLLSINQEAYNLLKGAGNTNTTFVTFEGGHEHLDSNEELMYLWMKEFVNEDYTGVTEPLVQNTEELHCYPNPFIETTTLRFFLDKSNFVNLSIYNCNGELVETLLNKTLPQGYQEVIFSSTTVLPGIYYCRLEIGGKQFNHKIIIKAN